MGVDLGRAVRFATVLLTPINPAIISSNGINKRRTIMTQLNIKSVLDSYNTRKFLEGNTASMKTSVNNINAIYNESPEKFEKGLNALLRVSGLTLTQLNNAIVNQDKKDAHYIPQKALAKMAGLISLFSGSNKGVDKYLHRFFGAIVNGSIVGTIGINPNGITGACFSSQSAKEYTSFKSAETPEQMDYLIDLSYPDFGTSTVNTQISQIKSLLIALNLIEDCKGEWNGSIKCTGKFARKIHQFKDLIISEVSSRQG